MRKSWAALPLALMLAAGCNPQDETPQQPVTTTTTATASPTVSTTTTTTPTTTTTTTAPPVEEATTTTPRRAETVRGGQFCSEEGATSGSYICSTTPTDDRARWRKM